MGLGNPGQVLGFSTGEAMQDTQWLHIKTRRQLIHGTPFMEKLMSVGTARPCLQLGVGAQL